RVGHTTWDAYADPKVGVFAENGKGWHSNSAGQEYAGTANTAYIPSTPVTATFEYLRVIGEDLPDLPNSKVAPTFSGAPDTQRKIRVNQNSLLTAANFSRLDEAYTDSDAISFWYTDDGTAPSKINGKRLPIYPAVTGQGTLAAPRIYLLDMVPGETYKVVAYVGDAPGAIGTYVYPLDAPRFHTADGVPMQIFDGNSAQKPVQPGGIYSSADIADGIKLVAGGPGQDIFYKTANVSYDIETGLFGSSPIDGDTAAQLISGGQSYVAPIQVRGASQTTGMLIRAVARKDGIANPSAVANFYVRTGPVKKLVADKDGNLQVDLDEFISQLTLDERILLTTGVGGDPTMLLNGLNYPLESNNDGIPLRGGPAGGTYSIPRLNIPALVLADGPVGLRNWKNATVWVAPAGQAATWNKDIVSDIGASVAREAEYFATDIVLGPGVNMQRNPIAGRNFEYYSEDPLLAGTNTTVYVDAVQKGGAGVSLKHSAANDFESGRSNGSSNVTERALREIYLRPFEMSIDVQPWTIMSGYNSINGVKNHNNYWLHTQVLRDEWGFEGYVMTDWGTDSTPWTFNNANLRGVGMIYAGTDMGQSTRQLAATRNGIVNAPDEATRDERIALLNRAVKRILQITVKTFAFQGRYGELQPDGSYADGVALDGTAVKGLTQKDIGIRSVEFGGSAVQKASAAVNKQAADEAITLLKNLDGTLPLKPDAKIALVSSRKAWTDFFNPRWYGDSASLGDIALIGAGSGQVRFSNNTVPYAFPLREALARRGFDVVDWKIDAGAYGGNNDDFVAAFTDNPPANGNSKYVFSLEQSRGMAAELAAYAASGANGANNPAGIENAKAAAEEAASKAEVGIFVLSRIIGEGSDLSAAQWGMETYEKIVFNAYADAFHAAGKKMIALINYGSSVDMTEYMAKADAILHVWLPGTDGTFAIADILNGTVNPSARLAQSFPVKYTDSPSVASAKPGADGETLRPTVNGSNAYYDEGVYVGYRYYESNPDRYADMVAYPFGYGLSYTDFTYSDFELDKSEFSMTDPDDKITATVTVTNSGDMAGKEVVQLYLNADTWQDEGRPKNELKAYAKTKLLQPGESETVTLELKLRDLQYYDDGNPEQIVPNVNNSLPFEDRYVKYGEGDGWTVAPSTGFTAMIRTNASDAATPNIAFDGLTQTFSYGPSDEPGTYTVTFDADGGTPVPAAQTVAEGGTATTPGEDPVKAGYTFDGWYLGDDTEPFDFSEAISGNITLTAHWTLVGTVYTVTFNAAGGAPVPAAQTVLEGGNATRPAADPVRAGYTFDGWYLGDATTAFNFTGEAISGDITLTARWTPVVPPVTSYTVTFDADGGTPAPAAQTVVAGEKATSPQIPLKQASRFNGWYTAATGGTLFDFDTPITGNITLYAHWGGVVPPSWAQPGNGTTGGGGTTTPPPATVEPDETPLAPTPDTTTPDTTTPPDSSAPSGGILSVFTDGAAVADWASAFVERLVGAGVISGRTDGTLDPKGDVTRAEFTKMVVQSLGISASGTAKTFTDVTAADWHKEFVDIASSANIVLGLSADIFGPDSKITRQDLCVIMFRALATLNVAAPAPDGSVFPDADAVADYAKDAVSALKQMGIVQGRTDGRFDPQAFATREETAKIICGIVDYVAASQAAAAPVEEPAEAPADEAGEAADEEGGTVTR
ncbi:MAG: InlB B-repeat-containing protein, partial [Clostridiales Family XIII bacterium]|nr:InlB B-repeat-containing protein [Clostridiales Family XIII bacterium]